MFFPSANRFRGIGPLIFPFIGLLVVPSLFLPSLLLGQGPEQKAGDHTSGVTIELERGEELAGVFKVVGWRRAREFSRLTPEQGRELFAVYVVSDSLVSAEGADIKRTPERVPEEIPPVAGSYQWKDGVLRFQPRYPLQPGLRYRAVFTPPHSTSTLTSTGEAAKPLTVVFEIPKPEMIPTTVVEQVYPTADRLPENQLKFYLHFSAPMSRGEAYRRIVLLDEEGRPVELPFLELDEELWDVEGKRLTLLFDPGRVKRDLMPNREVGPPLRQDHDYTLVIDRRWLDAEGTPLRAEYRKAFHVAPPDRVSPDLSTWRLTPPRLGNAGENAGGNKRGTREPLAVEFPEPLDQALLLRLLDVVNAAGKRVDGSVEVDKQETRWRFTPAQGWKPGRYFLSVGTTLEDLAGNSVGRLFEVAAEAAAFERREERHDQRPGQQIRRLPFEVHSGNRSR